MLRVRIDLDSFNEWCRVFRAKNDLVSPNTEPTNSFLSEVRLSLHAGEGYIGVECVTPNHLNLVGNSRYS